MKVPGFLGTRESKFMEWITKIDFYIVVILLALICVQDVRSRIISNRNIIFTVLALCPLIFLSGNLPNLPLSLAALCVGFLLFLGNVLGAGDVKLISVLALSFSLSSFYQFLLMTAMFGGVIALIGLVFFRKSIKQNGLPYGVAISLAFVFSYP